MGDFEDNILGGQQKLFDVTELPDELQQRVLELKAWLEALEDKIGTETLRKAVQYGSADLEVIGHSMGLLLPEGARDQRMALQMGIAFYALGKIARVMGAFEQGHSPQYDDWFDLMVYAKMGLKVMDTGRWL
jgi:hypothetical protein